MKTATVIRLAVKVFFFTSLVLFLAGQTLQAQVEENLPPEPSDSYNQEELAQMLAPIALYPDSILSQVLMAATYPIEVIEADRWVKKNPDLKGINLDEALKAQEWDPSVKALCSFPTILSLMSDRIADTANIGNAFLAQEGDVLAMIQELRSKAHAQGNLTTTKEQKVIVEKETIIIEPADPSIIYVPYYDPLYIYGPWWYPAYPPYYWGPPGISIGIGISYWPGFYFGYTYGSWSYFDWHRHHIYIDVYKRPRYVRHDRWRSKPGNWQHDPRHRRGVAYRDKTTARKYGQYHRRTRDFGFEARGFPPSQNLDRNQKSRFDDRTSVGHASRGGAISKPNRNAPEQRRYERTGPERYSTDRFRSERTRIEQDRRKPQSVQRNTQQRSPSGYDRKNQSFSRNQQTREPFERNQRQWNRDSNIFNRVDNGRQERESSMRGQSSRQGWRNTDPAGGNRMKSNTWQGGSQRSRGGSRHYGSGMGHKR